MDINFSAPNAVFHRHNAVRPCYCQSTHRSSVLESSLLAQYIQFIQKGCGFPQPKKSDSLIFTSCTSLELLTYQCLTGCRTKIRFHTCNSDFVLQHHLANPLSGNNMDKMLLVLYSKAT